MIDSIISTSTCQEYLETMTPFYDIDCVDTAISNNSTQPEETLENLFHLILVEINNQLDDLGCCQPQSIYGNLLEDCAFCAIPINGDKPLEFTESVGDVVTNC
jgi:hypothetical protein